MLVGDIYGGRDYTGIGLSANTIASSFGKVINQQQVSAACGHASRSSPGRKQIGVHTGVRARCPAGTGAVQPRRHGAVAVPHDQLQHWPAGILKCQEVRVASAVLHGNLGAGGTTALRSLGAGTTSAASSLGGSSFVDTPTLWRPFLSPSGFGARARWQPCSCGTRASLGQVGRARAGHARLHMQRADTACGALHQSAHLSASALE